MMNWINKKRNKKGFTLVELVVVIAILGILGAIAVPKLTDSRKNASIAAHNANVRTLESAATLAISEGTIFEKVGSDYKFKDVTDTGATWEGGVESETNKLSWTGYLQSWPKLPNGPEYSDLGTSQTTYKVEINKSTGEIKVTPKSITP